MSQCQLKHVPISTLDRTELLTQLVASIENRQTFLPVVTFNLTMFGLHSKDQLDWLRNHAIFTPDGIGIALLLALFKLKYVKRYPGIDMVADILQKVTSPLKVALIGASAESLSGTVHWIKQTGHEVVFKLDGFSDIDDNHALELKQASPDLILVACGCPKQDEIIYHLSTILDYGVAIGVGGSFDIWSGNKIRAPRWLQLLGLEWLFRLVYEPRRVFRLLESLIYFFTPTGLIKD